jgi:hypothetical protein
MTIALSIFLKGLNVVSGTPKTADNTRGWKRAERLAYADVVLVFGCTRVLNDHDFHVARAPVLEVVHV